MTNVHGSPSAALTVRRAATDDEMTWRPAEFAAREPVQDPNAKSPSPADDAVFVHAAEATRTALRDAASALAEAAVRAHSLAALLGEALLAPAGGETAPVHAPTPRAIAPPQAGALSPREQDVLALVAAGQTNKAIAEALFVSPNTVKTHVASLLHKLQADTRVQLAAIAATQGLHHHRAPASRLTRVRLEERSTNAQAHTHSS